MSAVLLQVPQLHLHEYCFIPQVPLFRPRKKDRRRGAGEKVGGRGVIKARFSCRSQLFSCEVEKNHGSVVAEENSDVGSSGSPPVEQLFDTREIMGMIQSCSSEREVRRVHSVVVKFLGNSVTFVDNNLISAYVRFCRVTDARKLFDKMYVKTVVSWTAILNGYLKMGMEAEFTHLYGDMIESGIQANSLTYVCVLNFCSKILDFRLGKQIHASVTKGNWNNLIVDSALLYLYAQCGDLPAAFRMFNGMPAWDVVCWTTMITACAQHGLGNRAFSMFAQMQYHGFRPNEFTVASVLKACGEEKDLKLGKQLHAAVVKRVFKEDVFVGSSLVGMYAKCGEVLDARTVFDLMPRRNTVTWTSMIAGYAQNGLGVEAIELFRKMKSRRIFANNLTVVSVLSACGLVRSLLLGQELHGLILKWSSQSNMHIGSTLVWFYCKCEEHDYAGKVLETLPLKDVIPWTAIISGYTNHGYGLEALSFLNQMLLEGIEPNPFTYSSALKACARLEDVVQGKRIHAAVNKASALSNIYVCNSLISLYMKCGCFTDAFKVFEMMPERNSVSWKAIVIGYAKNGLCDEALKLMYCMEAEGFDADDYIRSTVLTSCGEFSSKLQVKSTCLPAN
ncbi:hypothetical protein Taro_024983 [Colocasia esculenta]|uniref:Pentatricopeptide repeat-containing protein n=1 Tax=Colocasia esculenta TaxID=4460 RepID=A0A843VF80_COLES|nr:hypothetical protein [Colocasia esculenta]